LGGQCGLHALTANSVTGQGRDAKFVEQTRSGTEDTGGRHSVNCPERAGGPAL